ncbi:MAG: hypothetical protein QMB55_05050 [Propionivibrio sp.]
MTAHKPAALVFRQVAFSVASFDYLKDFQRSRERAQGVRLNNNQTLAIILAEHQRMNVERGERNEQTRSTTGA